MGDQMCYTEVKNVPIHGNLELEAKGAMVA